MNKLSEDYRKTVLKKLKPLNEKKSLFIKGSDLIHWFRVNEKPYKLIYQPKTYTPWRTPWRTKPFLDLRKTNSSISKLTTLNSFLRKGVNNSFDVTAEGNPILMFGLGLIPFNALASVLFAGFSLTMTLSTKKAKVYARDGDEIWRLEVIGKGKDGKSFEHAEFIILVDPIRAKSCKSQYEFYWVVAERERREIKVFHPAVIDWEKGDEGITIEKSPR